MNFTISCAEFKKIFKFVLAVTLSATAYYFSTGFHNVWILTWLAPLPILIYALEARVFTAIIAGFMAYFLGATNILVGYAQTMLPLKFFFYSMLLDAFVFAIMVIIFRYVVKRTKHWSASLVFASGWTAYEFLTSLISSAGTFSSIAYSQISNLPIIQIASITGIWGITFLLTLVPAGLALLWYYRRNITFNIKAWVMPIILLVVTSGFGLYRLYESAPTPSIKIGMAAINRGGPIHKDFRQVQDIVSQYGKSIALLKKAGAEVVLLPEEIAHLTPQTGHKVLQHLSSVARRYQVSLIVGLLMQHKDAKYYNSVYLFSQQGKTLLRYNKQHLLPATEAYITPGNKLAILKTPSMGKWGFAICKDMDFVNPSREYGKQGVNILFVPALDFNVDDWLHASMAIMRGVENNYAVARSTGWGLLTLTDSRGRVVAQVSASNLHKQALLVGELKIGEGNSIYSRFGDWFAWLCVGLFGFLVIVSLLIAFAKRKQKGSGLDL